MRNGLFYVASLTTLACVSSPALAQGQALTRSFNVLEQPAADGLRLFAQQAGIQVIAPAEATDGQRTAALHGNLSVADALRRLIAPTRLVVQSFNGRTLVLVRAPATAAAEPQATDPDAGQDIVVTARRTEERAQNVPLSVTAFTQSTLREHAISNGTDLQNFTPSLSVVGHFARNQENYTIRGMGGSAGQGTGSGPGVVGYFAEVPSTASGPGNFFDLASLQVLKGPQGTLFGRNTTGGAVLLEPMRPRMDRFEGYVEGTVANLARRGIQGAVNVPVIDDVLSIRVAGQYDKRDGYVRDVVTGRDYLNRNNYSVRLGIQFDPTPTIKSYTAVSYIDVNEHGGGNVLLSVNPASVVAPLLTPYLLAQQARGVHDVAYSVQTHEILKNLLILNNTQWTPVEGLTIKNIFSYGRYRSSIASEGDGTVLPISDLIGPYPGSYNINNRTITEEFQGRWDSGRFSLQGGGFYLRQTTASPLTFRTINPLQYAVLGGGPIVLPPVLQTALGLPTPLVPLTGVQPRAEAHLGSKAVYAQASYKILAELTATAGFRWTWDTYGGHIEQYYDPASFDVFPRLAALGVIPAATAAALQQFGSGLCIYDAYQAVIAGKTPTVKYPNCTYVGFEGKSNGPTWQIGLDWQANPQTLVYAVSRRGYKSGASNPTVALFLGSDYPLYAVRPEKVTDAEIGLKRDWQIGGVRARTNISAFYTWYHDIQVVQRAAIAGTDITANAQRARVMGVEFEGSITPFRPLTITATYSYNSAKYLEYRTIAIPDIPAALTAAQPSLDLKGTPFLFVPKHKYSIDGRLALPIPDTEGDLALRATWSWQSSQLVAVDPQPFDVIPAYGLLNLRLEWNNMRGLPLDFAVFGTNVLDKEYRITADTGYTGSGFNSAIYGEPTQYGVSLRYRF